MERDGETSDVIDIDSESDEKVKPFEKESVTIVDREGKGSGEGFVIDKRRLSVVPLKDVFEGNNEDTLENLQQLGVETFNAQDVEDNVLVQIEEHKAREDKKKKGKRRKKDDGGPSKVMEDTENKSSDSLTEQEKMLREGLITPFGSTLEDWKVGTVSEEPAIIKDDMEDEEEDSDITESDEEDEDYDEDKEMELNDVYEERKEKQKKRKRETKSKSKSKAKKKPRLNEGTDWEDDGDIELYKKRIQRYNQYKLIKEAREAVQTNQSITNDKNQPDNEFSQPPKEKFVSFGGFNLQEDIFNRLFPHQKTGVRWMWELHNQGAGGIIADEMGLGKTIQVIAFLIGLQYSNKLDGPTMIVCPATLLNHWVYEFHIWWPPFCVSLLHSTGTFQGDPIALIRRVAKSKNEILITSYEQVRIYHSELREVPWVYMFCDEGHKLRNPDANITLLCKQFETPHRILITGAPIQNNLTELWSLFDFVFPGKLGTLPTFQKQFSDPISRGGYANATPIQVHTAYQCALTLRDIINPYLLRRLKKDVKINLPSKREQVLFCPLTVEQRTAYNSFLNSKDAQLIFNGNKNCLFAIDALRKICNHPILANKEKRGSVKSKTVNELVKPSAKLKVLSQILPLWQKQNHKVLIFCQTKQMLDVLEHYVANAPEEYSYRRMDGSTRVGLRMGMVTEFNKDDTIFLFLLTTKTGGIGINLTGADRVIIFDPDWNPSTDSQARERSWRIGQKKDVTVYRLITSGTIEEKIYHRQIYKNFLTSKVLKDPGQTNTLFKHKNLQELLRLDDDATTDEAHEMSKLYGEIASVENNKNLKSNHSSRPKENEKPNTNRKGIFREAKTLGFKKSSTRTTKVAPRGNKSQPGKEKVQDEDGLLKSLMGEALSTMLDHDKIEDWKGNKAGHASYNRISVERQAERVAVKAAEALRKDRVKVQVSGLSAPTWTGRSGIAGAPPGKKRFGSVSRFNSNQNNLKSTTHDKSFFGSSVCGISTNEKPLSSEQLIASLDKNGVDNPRLITQIHNYFLAREGKAKSDELVNFFKPLLPKDGAVLFKKMLQQIATFVKDKNIWELKEDYKQ